LTPVRVLPYFTPSNFGGVGNQVASSIISAGDWTGG
jgi:hypothetical protein